MWLILAKHNRIIASKQVAVLVLMESICVDPLDGIRESALCTIAYMLKSILKVLSPYIPRIQKVLRPRFVDVNDNVRLAAMDVFRYISECCVDGCVHSAGDIESELETMAVCLDDSSDYVYVNVQKKTLMHSFIRAYDIINRCVDILLSCYEKYSSVKDELGYSIVEGMCCFLNINSVCTAKKIKFHNNRTSIIRDVSLKAMSGIISSVHALKEGYFVVEISADRKEQVVKWLERGHVSIPVDNPLNAVWSVLGIIGLSM